MEHKVLVVLVCKSHAKTLVRIVTHITNCDTNTKNRATTVLVILYLNTTPYFNVLVHILCERSICQSAGLYFKGGVDTYVPDPVHVYVGQYLRVAPI